MHYLRVKFTFLLSFFAASLCAQPAFKLIKHIPKGFDYVSTDNLGQVYGISGGEIIKYSAVGEEMMRNSVRLLGDITSVDFKNALKPMVFFKDLSQVSFLDNQLANRGDVLRLDALGYPQAVAVCPSYNNGLWIFDQVTFELIRIDERSQVTNQSGSLLQMLGVDINPVELVEGNDRLFMVDETHGIFVFDVFGTYYNTLPIKGVRKADAEAKQLYLLKEEGIVVYDTKSVNEFPLSLPVEGIKTFAVHGKHLYLATEKAFYIFERELE